MLLVTKISLSLSLYLCLCLYLSVCSLNYTKPRYPTRLSYAIYFTRIGPPKGGSESFNECGGVFLVTRPLFKIMEAFFASYRLMRVVQSTWISPQRSVLDQAETRS